MKKTKHKKVRITLLVLLCLLLVPLAGLLIVAWAVLPPAKLTPLAVGAANEYLDADLQCAKIELTYFETFPHLGIALTDGKLISHTADDPAARRETDHAEPTDSLVSFDRCVVAVHPVELLFNKRLLIKKIILVRPRLYGYVNESGRANWDVYRPAADSAATADSTGTEAPMPVEIGRIRIIDGTLTYDDRQTGLYTHLEGFYFSSDGSFAAPGHTRNLETGWKSLLFESPEYTLENKLEFGLKSRIRFSDGFRRIDLSETEMQVNRLPFTLNGSVRADSARKCLDLDLDYGLNVPDLNTLLAFLPSAYLKKDRETKITGAVRLNGTVRGALGENIYPVISACCILENGSLQGASKESGIDSLALDVDLLLNTAHRDSSYIELSRLFLQGKHCVFDMQASVTHLLNNPEITAAVKGDIDFTEISKNFFRSDTLAMEGTIRADLNTRFRMSDVTGSNYGHIFAQGQLDIRDFKAVSDPYDIRLTVTQARLNVDSETRAEKFLKDQKLMNTRLNIDSLNIRWKDKIVTTLAGLELALSAPPTADTTAVVPLAGRVRFDRLRTLLPDSVWLWAGKTEMKGALKPSLSNKKIPVAAVVLQSDSLAYLSPQYHSGILLADSEFKLTAFPYRTDSTRRRPLAGSIRRDSLRRRPAVRRDTTLMLDREASKLLRRWDMKGNVVFNDMKVFSPFFPVRMRMSGSNVAFTTDGVTLSDARLQLGKSDFTLNGQINSLRRALLRGGRLSASLSVASDYIDCNELMNALSRGLLYSDRQAAVSQADMATEGFADFQESAGRIAESTEAPDTSGVFILPEYLDLSLQMQAKKIDFDDLALDRVSGRVVMRDQQIQLTDLDMHSNIGEGRLTMIYAAKDKSGAYAGFDLDMERIQVDKLIGLFPSMDTLVPMLRSFEGIVDCQLAATCNLDSTLSVRLPSLYSACHLAGKNMVLLDGETFAEISKKLMFKNKKRNMIDQIAVDLVVKDNKIEVFPFLVEMDRYRVAVGGTHNLDMSFNYHISVLKSPVPFKLGINITGTLDRFKFGIGKCKYKDLFKPAKSSVLDSTNIRLNVREDIYQAIRKQLQASLFGPGRLKNPLLEPGDTHLAEYTATTGQEADRTDSVGAVSVPAAPSPEEPLPENSLPDRPETDDR